MWIRISLVLLSTFVVSSLSLPHPDERQYEIPDVGTGERSQFYVLHSDGTFKYGFDSGDGTFEKVKSQKVADREGKFGYVDPDGNAIHLEYEAGKGGFVARGDHLPKASPELAQALAHVVANAKPFLDPLATEDSDASYGFGFETDDHSRKEQSDADGTVTGSYSYLDENGVTRSFTYKAGKGIGFVIEGDGLTQDISAPSSASAKSGARRTYHSSRSRQTTLAAPHQTSRPRQSAVSRTRTPAAHLGGNFASSNIKSYSGPEADVQFSRSQTPGDASYSFSFDADDHSRSEFSDSDLNVDGSFSFVADDGDERTVNYIAGSSTGFRAEGDHLPRAPAAQFSGQHRALSRGQSSRRSHQSGFKTTTDTQRRQGPADSQAGRSYFPPTSGFHSTQASSTLSRRPSPARSGFQGLQRHSSRRPFEEANVQSSFSPSGAYSFSYDTSSHSRSESGDEDNNVVGEFEFVADDDGERREVKYEAGSATGFIAEGDHLPVGPEVPGAPSGQPTGRIVRVSSTPFEDPLASTDSDASYDFEFDSDTYSRRESSDKDGNVVGSYTYVDDDGTARSYNFRAGEGIGFETEEVSTSRGRGPSRSISQFGLSSQAVSRQTPTRSTVGSRRTKGHSPHFAHQPSFSSRSRLPTTNHLSGSSASSYIPPVHHTSQQVSSPVSSFRPQRTRSQVRHRGATHSSSSFGTAFPSTSPGVDPTPNFVLNRYDATPNSEKFGYVLRFN